MRCTVARLILRTTFKALHGTERVRDDEYIVEVAFDGPLESDFIAGIDYDIPQRRIDDVVRSLSGMRLDDITGRATAENIAAYLLYKLEDVKATAVTVYEGQRCAASISTSDICNDNYSVTLQIKRAKSFLVRRRFDAAIAAIDTALLTGGDRADVYNLRGRCYKYLNQYEQALADYSTALSLDPHFGEAYRNRGNAHYYLGHYDVMIADFDRAIQIMPDSAVAYNNRGFAFQALGEYERAVADHSRAIELNPNYAEAYHDRGDARKALGHHELAQVDYETGSRLGKCIASADIEWSKLHYTK